MNAILHTLSDRDRTEDGTIPFAHAVTEAYVTKTGDQNAYFNI